MRTCSRLLMVLLMLAALPVMPAEELPIPPGSRRNEALGGATTLAPGKNYVRSVYETPESIDAVTDFYQRRLSGVAPVREGRTVTFSTAQGVVKLVPLENGTRITLIVGPR